MWLWNERNANWYFFSLPLNTFDQIKEIYGWTNNGFGSIPVTVTINKTTWKTSIFPSKGKQTYILPIKAIIRKALKLELDQIVKVKVEIK